MSTAIHLVTNEAGDLSEYAGSGGTVSVQGTIKRTGTSALKANPTTTGTGFARATTTAASGSFSAESVPTIFPRFYFYYVTKPASDDEPFFGIGASTVVGNSDIELRINSSGQVVAYDSQSGIPSLLATGSTALSSGTWYRVEVSADNSDGVNMVWEVKLNGTPEISGSFADGAGTSPHLFFGKMVNRNGQSVEFYYDDILSLDDAYPGPGQGAVLIPDGDGNYTNGTANGAATKWGCLTSVPTDGDTTYVNALGNGNAYTATMGSSAGAGISGTVNAARTHLSVKRDGGTNGSTKVRSRWGSTDNDTSAATATSSYAARGQLFTTSPATGLALTTADLDSCEVGMVENSANASRVSAAFLFVDYYNENPSTFNSPGAFSWTSPVTGTVTAECWGEGGLGGNAPGPAFGGAGGGGGAYAKKDISVTAGSAYAFFIGTSGNAEGSYFVDASSVFATYGIAGSGTTAGAGGQSSGCVGTTKFSGGAGGAVGTTGGGGGGSSAGTAADGNTGSAGSTITGGAGGVAVTGGAAGGKGGNFNQDGTAGTQPGGGGGGSGFPGSTGIGGVGGNGRVRLTYTAASSVASPWFYYGASGHPGI